jgi:hypothetical protein
VYSLLAIADDAASVPVDYSTPEHVFITSLVRSYNKSMCLCSLVRLADVLDCVGPFAKLAPRSLLVQLSLTATELEFEPRPTTALTPYGEEMLRKNPQCLVCLQCDEETLAAPETELVFCPSQECNERGVEGHLVVSKTTQSRDIFALKLVARHKKGSAEYPRLFERSVDIISFGLEDITEDDFLLRLMQPSLYSSILPFESLVDIALNVVHDERRLCQNAEKAMGGLHFLDKHELGSKGDIWESHD